MAALGNFVERNLGPVYLACLFIGLPALAMVLACVGAVVALLMGWRPWL